ncbi:MAG: tRNA pseudouridine(38-40) synthase TruA [Gammaproteobacteria bacterium]
MTRYALGVEYNGSRFCGWQVQAGVPTVQEEIERAIREVADHEVRVVTAGRTDTGVHALGQVIHFESTSLRPLRAWVKGVNSNLPDGVVVTWARQVPDEFHARFCASGRAYRYIMLTRPVRPTVLAERVTWTHEPLERDKMRHASRCLIGRHDFSAYRSVHCQSRQPIRHVRKFSISQKGLWTWFDIEADGFLHHMVRNIAGVLMSIGSGAQDVSWAREILDSRDRRQGGVTAPAAGLYLTGVQYPSRFHMPDPPEPLSFW